MESGLSENDSRPLPCIRIRAGKRDLEQALALHLEMLNVYEALGDQDGLRHLEQTRMAEHVESLIDQMQASP
jgi:hypothetical protein